MRLRIVATLADIDPAQWDILTGSDPFICHAYLHALHESGSAAPANGWQPCYLTLWDGEQLEAALPLYRKQHSFGEFVFDWAWADAYARNGLAYYPKLVAQVPFAPVSGRRLLARSESARRALLDALRSYADESGLSSLHVLFPTPAEAAAFEEAGMLLRHGVQFHWRNEGWTDFDAFLGSLTRDKRKKIRQDRRHVGDAGIVLHRLTGSEISADDWRLFHACYERTYTLRGRRPYLNFDFFQRIGRLLPENLLLVRAERDGQAIAASLCIRDQDRLCGRYWGALEDVPYLHFEASYYQPLEFCLEQGIAIFEGGAQGEHKLARGFLPVQTQSAHWLADSRYHAAVARFLDQERQGITQYLAELQTHNPYAAR